jgi:hypothetical protein
MIIKIKKDVDLKMPRMPNFLRYENDDEKAIDVADLNLEQIEHIAECMKTAFIEHVKTRIRTKISNRE